MKAIQVENLKKVYNPYSAFSKVALKDVSLEVEESEFICIMGTSGSGKTTLINVLSTIDDVTNGKIQINLHNLITMSENEKALLRKKEIGFIFQNYNLIDYLTPIENVRLVNKNAPETILFELGLDKSQINRNVMKLSGGQQQRVAIARALVNHPEIVLADEPTGNLDMAMGNEVIKFLKKMNELYNQTIVIVTHDQDIAAQMDRIITIADGSVINDKEVCIKNSSKK